MDENNSRRNDATIKTILSGISDNEKIIQEVRQLVAENFDENNNKNTATTKTASSNSSPPEVIVSGGEKKAPSPNDDENETYKRKISSSNNNENEEDELAFTIDRNSETYRNILSIAKWYRDSFFISSDYANDRQEQRRSNELNEDEERRRKLLLHQQQQNIRRISNSSLRRYRPQMMPQPAPIPLSSALALGHPLLLSIGENYIRSKDAVDLLRPHATWLASKHGGLFPIASQSLSQTIPLAQASCDWVVRDNVLWLLQDQEWRDFAKSITTQYIRDEVQDEK